MDELRHEFEVNVFGPVAVMESGFTVYACPTRGTHPEDYLHVRTDDDARTLVSPRKQVCTRGDFLIAGQGGRPLGIYVTAVEPGMFRTDWAGRSMVRSKRSIPDYDAIFNPIREARKARSGQQEIRNSEESRSAQRRLVRIGTYKYVGLDLNFLV